MNYSNEGRREIFVVWLVWSSFCDGIFMDVNKFVIKSFKLIKNQQKDKHQIIRNEMKIKNFIAKLCLRNFILKNIRKYYIKIVKIFNKNFVYWFPLIRIMIIRKILILIKISQVRKVIMKPSNHIHFKKNLNLNLKLKKEIMTY